MKLVVTAAAFLLALNTSTWAGFDDGTAAYERDGFSAAFQEFKTLAEAGDPAAQNKLGFLYESGRGVPQDIAEAVKWYRKAADQGNPEGQTNLAVMYLQGFGVARNPSKALKLFGKAAEKGYSMARTYRDLMSNGLGPASVRGSDLTYEGGANLAVFPPTALSPYYQRLGSDSEWLLPPRINDDADRLSYFCALARNSDPIAQNNVGLMYAEGRGIDRDYAVAYAWLSAAIKNGNYSARTARNLVAALMSHVEDMGGEITSLQGSPSRYYQGACKP